MLLAETYARRNIGGVVMHQKTRFERDGLYEREMCLCMATLRKKLMAKVNREFVQSKVIRSINANFKIRIWKHYKADQEMHENFKE